MPPDDGRYLASEATFNRVRRDEGQAAHRSHVKKPRAVRLQTTHVATAPRKVWCWDTTYLPATVIGVWFDLYLILVLGPKRLTLKWLQAFQSMHGPTGERHAPTHRTV